MNKHGETKKPLTLTGEQARQGKIILNTRTRRIVFIAGIVGVIVLGFIVQFAAHT